MGKYLEEGTSVTPAQPALYPAGDAEIGPMLTVLARIAGDV